MAKVRFLQSVALVSSPKTYGYNDEAEINDERLLEHLVKKGLADVLIEDQPEPKSVKKSLKKAPKKPKNEVDLDA